MFISFLDEIRVSKQNSHKTRRHVIGYSVCLCHIKKDAILIWVNQHIVVISRCGVPRPLLEWELSTKAEIEATLAS